MGVRHNQERTPVVQGPGELCPSEGGDQHMRDSGDPQRPSLGQERDRVHEAEGAQVRGPSWSQDAAEGLLARTACDTSTTVPEAITGRETSGQEADPTGLLDRADEGCATSQASARIDAILSGLRRPGTQVCVLCRRDHEWEYLVKISEVVKGRKRGFACVWCAERRRKLGLIAKPLPVNDPNQMELF
jgi:hypothetical protein